MGKKGDNSCYVLAADGIYYYTSNIFNTLVTWTIVPNVDKSKQLYISGDFMYTLYDTTIVLYQKSTGDTINFSPPYNLSFKYFSVTEPAIMYAMCSDNNVYRYFAAFATPKKQPVLSNAIKIQHGYNYSNSYIIFTSKYQQDDVYICIGDLTNQMRIQPYPNSKGVIDFSTDGGNNIWWIDSSNNLNYNSLSPLNNYQGPGKKIPLPPGSSNGIISIFANDVGYLGAIGKNGIFYYATQNTNSDQIIWINSYLSNLNQNVTNPTDRFFSKYIFYGNSIPVKKQNGQVITLTQVPVSYWRYDNLAQGTFEFWNSGCDGDILHSIPKINNFPIEAPGTIVTMVSEASASGCGWGAMRYWTCVNVDGLTHIFGDIGGNQKFPNDALINGTAKTQYSTPLNALQLGITPNNKVALNLVGINPAGISSDSDGLAIQNGTPNNPRPIFNSIQFTVPDPTDQVDIDPVIPWILCGYNAAQNFSNSDLYSYLSIYLFSKVVIGVDGNLYARVEFINNPQLSINSNSDISVTYLKKIVNYWLANDPSGFKTSGNTYCSGDNLSIYGNNPGWCYSSCGTDNDSNSPILSCNDNLTAFCQLGPNGKYDDPDKVITFTQDPAKPDKQIQKPSTSDLQSIFPNGENLICSNFMPTSYYEAKLLNDSRNTDGSLEVITAGILNGSTYGIPECLGMNQKSKVYSSGWLNPSTGETQKCPDITICVDNVDIENAGKIIGNINIKQGNNCSGGGTPPPPDGPPSGSTKAEKIIIIVTTVTFLTILLLFLL